jgi:hypothetical protein
MSAQARDSSIEEFFGSTAEHEMAFRLHASDSAIPHKWEPGFIHGHMAEPNSPAQDLHVPLGNRSPWPRREKTSKLRSNSSVHNLHPGAGDVEHGHESNGSLGDG